jgi:poly(A) polymerase
VVTTLPAAPWTLREDLARLVAALGEGTARYVGGAVRDTLLGIEVKDVDLATALSPREVMKRLKAQAIQVVPTGIDHGTVTAVLPQGPVEITTLRHDVSTDGRRATIAFVSEWQDDAARRDFTINALYADPASGEVFDWFGGLADLAARRVRFIGDPRQRIREDHLRILRYFRFQARFGSQPADFESENACSELAATLKGLSRERVGMEMINLLGLADPAPTLARMEELGVLAEVLPEANVAALAALVAEERKQDVVPDALRRLAALLPADAQLVEAVASRFRLSGAQKKRLALAAGRDLPGTGRGTSAAGGGGSPHGATAANLLQAVSPLLHPADGPTPRSGEGPRALAYRLGREAALDRLLLTGADTAPLKDWVIPQFPLKGGAIVAYGVKAGPQVARTLKAVEARWIAGGFDDAAIPALLDAELAGRP